MLSVRACAICYTIQLTRFPKYCYYLSVPRAYRVPQTFYGILAAKTGLSINHNMQGVYWESAGSQQECHGAKCIKNKLFSRFLLQIH